jgi:hypothetical protein
MALSQDAGPSRVQVGPSRAARPSETAFCKRCRRVSSARPALPSSSESRAPPFTACSSEIVSNWHNDTVTETEGGRWRIG